ncbi:MAG: flagellar biosynthesis protein FliQ [Bacteroidetes bacterium]|nr:flagellar biosynthesis protein FliQ [Bacteroidota bacterium]MCH8523819.1 flagellar biosynthesis protein FliQ [Balneolales bacterium]
MNTDIGVYWIQEALTAAVVLSAPILIGALAIGLAIAIFQAATSIQEMTLSFVPKMLVVVIIMFLLFGFMLQYAINFTERVFDFIPQIAR